MSDIFTQLQENLDNSVKTAEPLANHTNFKIGGPAKYFFTAHNTKELVKVIQVVDELKLPFIVLGGGSNVLVSDAGFQGMVIIVKNNHLSISGNKVVADAGVNLGYLVQKTMEHELTGLEPLVAVPGTVGGAVYGNAGLPQTPRGFIGDWVKKVEVCRGDKLVRLTKEECNFDYRDSFFKHNGDIILTVTFTLEKGDKIKSQELIKKYTEARKNQPYSMPSTGCVFTNFKITDLEEVKAKFKNEKKLDEFIQREQVPASWLIDKTGLKGKTIGGAQVSEKHANYIVNVGNAKAEDVVMLISFIKQQVRDKFGVQLQEEVQYIGF
jgi:UDP-N-acetylmuramate dehydrogenase